MPDSGGSASCLIHLPDAMFKAAAEAFVNRLTTGKHFIPNEDPETEVDLLTLVRIKKGNFWNYPKYKVLRSTLPKLVGVKTFSPGEQFEAVLLIFLS